MNYKVFRQTLVILTTMFAVVLLQRFLMTPNEATMMSSNNPSASQAPSNNIRPLQPKLLLPEQSQCNEVQGEVSTRFNLPAARLVNLPVNSLEKICSQVLALPGERLKDYLEEDQISYTAISSIRYDMSNGNKIFITTLLMSQKAAALQHKPFENTFTSDGSEGVRIIELRDGIQAMLFSNRTKQDIRNQVVFVVGQMDYKYYVTVGSNLSSTALVQVLSDHLNFE